MVIIAMDAHKHYSQICVERENGSGVCERRVQHSRGAIRGFLSQWEDGTAVALETVGNWYWIVDEIEAAGMQPKLVHAHKAKLMLGAVNKTDKLDARGLNRLQRAGTLPTVWIPPGPLRDQRELPRTRMVFARHRTQLKNRIHSVIDKYGLQDQFADVSDMFGRAGRAKLEECIAVLPKETAYTIGCLLGELDQVELRLGALERRFKKVFAAVPAVQRLMTLPGVGYILAVVIWLELGDVERFPTGARLASYSGTTPRVHSSGGKTRYGPLRNDVNHYLKWAFSEAANSIVVNHKRCPGRHVSRLYSRLRQRCGHAKAVGAVARHLAEAAYWVLKKEEGYKEPKAVSISSTQV
jgi:transposase